MIPALTPERLALLLRCSVRYALGRESVVVGAVCEEVQALAPHLPARELHIIRRDIAEQERHGYGRECDERAWRRLLDWLDGHLGERGEAEDEQCRPRVEVAGSSGTWVQGEAGPEFVPEPWAREAWEDARRRGEG